MSCVMQAKSAFLCVGGECFYNLIMAKKLAKLHCLGQNKIESYFSRIGVNAMNKNIALYNEMIAFFAGDARRCQHFIKVASLAKELAESEGADAELTELVEAAGLVHDCGIKPGEAKYGAGHCTGKIQEQEGPSVARGLLQKVGYTPEKIERICYLVGHHHTYNMIDGLDYQLLVEADFIVNFYENGTPKENIAKAVERIFKTESGTKLSKTMLIYNAVAFRSQHFSCYFVLCLLK